MCSTIVAKECKLYFVYYFSPTGTRYYNAFLSFTAVWYCTSSCRLYVATLNSATINSSRVTVFD